MQYLYLKEIYLGSLFDSQRYAFGIVMWEIASRTTPYKETHPDIVRICVGEEGQREEIVEGCPRGYMELVQRCWHQDPLQRPHIDQILIDITHIKHNFMACIGE